jgi:hypothetical protein
MEALYKFNYDSIYGTLSGLFIAKKDYVKRLINEKTNVYFGEVLGKHSEIFGSINNNEIEFVTDDSVVLEIVRKFNLEIGYNPLNCSICRDNKYNSVIEMFNNE